MYFEHYHLYYYIEMLKALVSLSLWAICPAHHLPMLCPLTHWQTRVLPQIYHRTYLLFVSCINFTHSPNSSLVRPSIRCWCRQVKVYNLIYFTYLLTSLLLFQKNRRGNWIKIFMKNIFILNHFFKNFLGIRKQFQNQR